MQGLETFNQVLDLEPDKCVQFALRNSALLGVGKERLQDVIVQVRLKGVTFDSTGERCTSRIACCLCTKRRGHITSFRQLSGLRT